MDRTGQENMCDMLKKAKAKKISAQAFDKTARLATDDRNEMLTLLNKELFTKISNIFQTNPTADLSGVEKVYRREARRITGVYDSFHTVNNPSKNQKGHCQSQDSIPVLPQKYYSNRYADKKFSESYLALASVMGINPLISKDDFLAALLEQSFDMFEEDKQPFTYIKVSDVIKTKGNSINGPRREDVGYYNRKLFENYTKEVNRTTHDQLVVNLKFFPKYSNFIGNDTIITSDFVQLYKFSGPIKQWCERCLFIIHQDDSKRRCTILYGDKVLFNKLERDQFKCALSKCKRKINILHYETFNLYSVEFICENAANRAFGSLFVETGRANYLRNINYS